jgi:hypothetical protein
LIIAIVLLGVMLAGGPGASVMGMVLTSAGLAMAWGCLLAGATAGGWLARLGVLGVLGLSMWPAAAALSRGYSGVLLLVGLAAFLVWRWWRADAQPGLDLAVTGALALVLFATLADRTAVLRADHGQVLYGLFLEGETAVLAVVALPILAVAGAAIGDGAGSLAGGAASWLVRLKPQMLLALTGVTAVAKLGWDLYRYHGAGWLTGLLLAAAWAAWYLLARPRAGSLSREGEWPRRMPGVVLLPALAFMLVNEFGRRVLPASLTGAQFFLFCFYATGTVALLLSLGALLAGRRPLALAGGLIGLWLLLASGDGTVPLPWPVFDRLSGLPKLELAAIDGLVTLGLAGAALWRWRSGRRDPAPYALTLGALAVMTGFFGADALMWNPDLAVIPVLVGAVYALAVAAGEAARREGRRAVTWAGLAMGGALLAFSLGGRATVTDMREMYSSAYMPALGYGIFALCLFVLELLRRFHAVTAEGRGQA